MPGGMPSAPVAGRLFPPLDQRLGIPARGASALLIRRLCEANVAGSFDKPPVVLFKVHAQFCDSLLKLPYHLNCCFVLQFRFNVLVNAPVTLRIGPICIGHVNCFEPFKLVAKHSQFPLKRVLPP